jgi:ACS family glucarate transporter-like MFS transporter
MMTTLATTPATRPTRVRYVVLALSVAMAILLYLDRMAMTVAVPAMAADIGVPAERVTDAMSVFFWIYALLQIPAGWLGDRWGGRRVLTLYVVAWSFAIAGMGLVTTVSGLVVMRGLLGVGQAGAYATTASFLRRWMPFGARGFANSAVSLGGRAGGVIAPALTAVSMALVGVINPEVARWRPVFIAYGVLGLVWAAIFWRRFRDLPSEHPSVNRAERSLIAGISTEDNQDTAQNEQPRVPTIMLAGRLISSPSIWALAVCNFTINVGWMLIGTLLPTFLIQAHGWSEVQAGFTTSLAAFAGMIGCLTGGMATDFLVRRLGLVWGRRVPCMCSYFGAAGVYAVCYFLDNPVAIVSLLVIASLAGDFGLGALWCTYQDLGGSYSGTVLGVGNMCGNIGAAIGISLVMWLAVNYGWSASFALSTVAYGIGGLAWLGIDPRHGVGT